MAEDSKFQRLLLALVLIRCVTRSQCNPQGCTYDAATKEYSCSFRSWSLPLQYSQFTNPVQVLKLVDVDGELPSASPYTFTGFSSHSTVNFDPSIDPRLEIHCYAGGQIIMTAGTFADMNWVEDFRIFNCAILTLPDRVFQEFGNLNYMSFEGGSIADSVGFDATYGINLHKMETSQVPKGIFSMKNCRWVAKTLQVGFLFSLGNASTIIIENCDIKTASAGMFMNSKKLTKLSLAKNTFYSLPQGVFDYTPSLKQIDLTGIEWTCSCENMWLQDWIENNNISLTGGIVCAYPPEKTNTRGKEYNKENCKENDPCGRALGINITKDFCLQVTDMILYGLSMVTLVLAIVSLVIIIHSRRQMPKPPEPPERVDRQEKTGSELTNLNEQVKKGPKNVKETTLKKNAPTGKKTKK